VVVPVPLRPLEQGPGQRLVDLVAARDHEPGLAAVVRSESRLDGQLGAGCQGRNGDPSGIVPLLPDQQPLCAQCLDGAAGAASVGASLAGEVAVVR